MLLNFLKYHGTGNDFILLDGRSVQPEMSRETIARLCDRRFGIGADGLIILKTAGEFDFRMVYFNSDGKESTMCGNGGRCIIAYADFLSLIENEAHFIAIDGPHNGKILEKKGDTFQVLLHMKDVVKIDRWRDDLVLDTGSPHLVVFRDELSFEDIRPIARPLRYHEQFRPGGINVNFVLEKDGVIHARTYERGVEDETLSCGTGVTASALAYAFRNNMEGGILPVSTKGGNLKVHFKRDPDGRFHDIWLEGPAVKVFEGEIRI